VTVGTELPFDRLIRAIDVWAGNTGRGQEVFAQVGHSEMTPSHIRWSEMLDAASFRSLFGQAELTIAHAGMGTILAALEEQRPLVVVPRRADLREHRNDHQLSTVAHLSSRGLLNVAQDEAELTAYLEGDLEVIVPPAIGDTAEPSLIDAVRAAVAGDHPSRPSVAGEAGSLGAENVDA
jgi:UDP-N-acetylglucosamine transferase subunit ALG13